MTQETRVQMRWVTWRSTAGRPNHQLEAREQPLAVPAPRRRADHHAPIQLDPSIFKVLSEYLDVAQQGQWSALIPRWCSSWAGKRP